MVGLRRLLALWRLYAQLDLLFITHDLRRFIIIAVAEIVTAIAAVTAMLLLAERFDGIGNWSKLQVAFLIGYGLMVNGLLEMCFGYNLRFISRRIGRGQLDHVLLQPHTLLTTFVTEGFSPFYNGGRILLGCGFLAWSIWRLDMTPTAGWLALLALQILASGAVVMAFNFIWGTLAFWAPRGAEEISSSTNRMLDELYPFPLDGVGAAARVGLLTILPIGFVAWYPSRALLGLDDSALGYLLTPLAGLVFAVLATLAFRGGLAHYAGTGSSRYSDFGHRR
jgi:ABC-2 type transport system permease protein